MLDAEKAFEHVLPEGSSNAEQQAGRDTTQHPERNGLFLEHPADVGHGWPTQAIAAVYAGTLLDIAHGLLQGGISSVRVGRLTSRVQRTGFLRLTQQPALLGAQDHLTLGGTARDVPVNPEQIGIE